MKVSPTILQKKKKGYCLLWIERSLLKVWRQREGIGRQRVGSGLHRGNEGNCVSGARGAGLKCVWSGQADESRGALWGERKKVLNKERQDYSYGALAVSLFMPLKDFPCHLFFAFLLFSTVFTRNPTFWLQWKHQHHGAALPRNGHHHTSSSRSKPLVRWQSPAELVDYRGEISSPIFLFQMRPERYSAVYEEDGRYLDVGGILKHRVLTTRIISVLTLKPPDLLLPCFSVRCLQFLSCTCTQSFYFRLLIPHINQMCRFLQLLTIFKVRSWRLRLRKLRAVISVTRGGFLLNASHGVCINCLLIL